MIPNETIKQIMIRRDNLTEQAAIELINQAREELFQRLNNDENVEDICAEYFGLEPDYLMELL